MSTNHKSRLCIPKYRLATSDSAKYTVRRLGAATPLGTFVLSRPPLGVGEAGFETETLSPGGGPVTYVLEPLEGATSDVVVDRARVTVRRCKLDPNF